MGIIWQQSTAKTTPISIFKVDVVDYVGTDTSDGTTILPCHTRRIVRDELLSESSRQHHRIRSYARKARDGAIGYEAAP